MDESELGVEPECTAVHGPRRRLMSRSRRQARPPRRVCQLERVRRSCHCSAFRPPSHPYNWATMATVHAALLSQHSSNPLEVPTSDEQNRKYLHQYHRARQLRDQPSSEDPIAGYRVPEVEEYHQHISQLFHKTPPPPPNAAVFKFQQKMREPVEDTFSDDELEIIGGPEDDLEMDDPAEDEDADESDGELSILLKSRQDQEEIEEEIQDLESAVPLLTRDYRIVDRLGTGTFSSVYKAIDLGYHTKWYNDTWLGRHPPESSAHYQSLAKPPATKVMVAIKRIYVTSNPERIRNEISILEDCRGCRHVSQLITAFRHEDQVVVVMPYHRNEDFRDFYRSLPMSGIKSYLRCLLRGLRDIHARQIIHRDVKPANFLFDTRTGIGTLCDFGLASVSLSMLSLDVKVDLTWKTAHRTALH